MELFVVLPEGQARTATPPRRFKDVMEFIASLLPDARTPEEWAEVEREFRAERDSWER